MKGKRLRRHWLAGIAMTPFTTGLALSPAVAQTGTDVRSRSNAPAVSQADDSEGDIVVTGLRASLSSSQELKRQSFSIVDAVVAEDIGKLPDNNASEALARVTGVQVTRTNDEAAGVLIRGLPDVATTFNGREIYTASGRGVGLQDFPAGALAALEVYKSGTADLVEPGLAGLVNVRSRRPFDFNGFELAGAVRGNYNEQSKKIDPIGNLLVSNRWDTGIGEIGALVNFAYTRARYRNAVRYNDQAVRTIAGNVATAADDIAVTTPGVPVTTSFPVAVGNFYSTGNRIRPSINGALQWRPSDNLEIYADGLWQAYRNQQSNEWFNTNLERASVAGVRPTFSNVVLDPASPGRVISLTKTGGYPAEMYRSTVDDQTDTFQGAAGFIWTIGRARLSSDFAYTNSTYRVSEYSLDSQFTSAPTVNVTFDRDGGAAFDLGGYDSLAPANYNWRGFFQRRVRDRGDGYQWRGDLELTTDLPIIEKIDVGARWVGRNAQVEQGPRYANTSTLGIPLASLPSGALQPVADGFRSDVSTFRTWLMPTRDAIRSNFEGLRLASIAALERLVAANPANAGFRDALAQFRTEQVAYTPNGGFSAKEDTYAFYAMGKYRIDIGPVYIDGTAGVRVVNTDGLYSGVNRVVAPDGAISFVPADNRQNYVDVLPSVGARLHLSPKFQMRFAYTQTRTRPSFGQLNPALNITRNNQAGGSSIYAAFGSGGNPDLVPLTSTNYDATAEWYFSRSGSLTGSVFYRDLAGFISSYTRDVQDPFYGLIQISRPENAGKGRIKGAEMAVQSFLDFLPGLLSGLGGQANVTYLDGTNQLPTVFGGAAPVVPITGVSKWTYNLTAFYEKGPVSTRLSYNRRSQFVNSFTRVTGQDQFAGVITRPISRLDFSLSVTPFDNLTLSADVSNILAQPFNNIRYFNATQFYPVDVREEGRYFSLGARFRFP